MANAERLYRADPKVSSRSRRRLLAVQESLERRTLLSAVPLGPEFQVNTWTTANQINSSVAMDHAGNFVVIWQSAGQDGDGDGIFGQRYSAGGAALGGEFQVNEHTTGHQRTPRVAMDADGDFVVTWTSFGQGGDNGEIWARRYTSAGAPADGEFHVNQTTFFAQLTPAVAMDDAGNFVVAWVSPGTGYDIYARRFSAAGAALSDEFVVNTYLTGSQLEPAVAMDADGDFVVTWQSFGQDGDNNGVFARQFSAVGTPLGDDFQVNQFTTFAQRTPAVAMDSVGNFVIAWESNQQDGSVYGVYARRYDAAAMPLGDEFRVNTHTFDSQRAAAVAMDNSGDFTITWASRGQDGSLYGIYAQCYNAAGGLVGQEFRVNTHTTGTQFRPAIAMDADGDFVISWQSDQQDGSGFGVFAQRFGAGEGGGPTVVESMFVWQNAPQRLEYLFSADVSASLDASDVLLENLSTGQPIPSANVNVVWNPVTLTASFRFPGYSFGALPDGIYRATLLASGVTDPGGNPLPANHISNFQFLMADHDQNGVVNLSDFNRLAANFGQSGRDFTQGNYNYDPEGLVNLSDFNQLASRFGMSLAPIADSRALAGTFGSTSKQDDSEPLIGVVD